MNLNHLLVNELVTYLRDNQQWFIETDYGGMFHQLDETGLREVLTSFFEQENKPKAVLLASKV